MSIPDKLPLDMLDHWAEERPDAIYLRQPRDGVYEDLTWGQVRDQARRIAGALRRLGLAPGDRVALFSKNCAEWFIADLAMMIGGHVSVPIYPSANAETIRYVVKHSEAKAIFFGKLDDPEALPANLASEILRLALPYETLNARYTWRQLLQLAEPLEDGPRPNPRTVMSIIYTSGSTGVPKGVVHTYGSLGWAGYSVPKDLGCGPDDRVISYLPLAHITERAYIEIASLYSGGTVAFTESRETFLDDVKRAGPTMFVSVPRLWSVFRENIVRRVGKRKIELLSRIPILGDILKRKIREGLGLQHANVLGSGSAPISPALLEWYRGVGMNITEAWGMTENCAYATLNYPFRADKIGSVGRPALDSEVKASESGELLFRGPGLMSGYYKQPDETAEVFTEDGFFRTGDLCRIDEEGYVYITGRAKDPFKTAKGKFVAPAPIEQELVKNGDIDMPCVIGIGMPQPIALVQLTETASERPREEVRASLQASLDRVNTMVESHARLDAIVVVSDPWTTENDAITPTLKVKRHVLDRRFKDMVQGLRGGQVRWQSEL